MCTYATNCDSMDLSLVKTSTTDDYHSAGYILVKTRLDYYPSSVLYNNAAFYPL